MMAPDLGKIPMELKIRPQWIAHRRDKTPVNTTNGRNAKADDPGTWGTYEQAVQHYEAYKNNGIAGIGYEFSADDPFTGIDLDECRDPETGEIEEWAKAIINRLRSYTEVSLSGRGVHILVKANLPPGGRRNRQIEMYDRGRYFAMTGHHLQETFTTIEDRQAEIEALHKEVFGKPPEEPGQGPPNDSRSDMSDFALIEKAQKARNGHKFAVLWDGDTSAYPSPSEADLALCGMLAFWTGPDPERIDRLFRQSELYREKWERQDYRDKTIKKALDGTTEFYNSGHSTGADDWEAATGGTELPKILQFPHEVMSGAAGRFAMTYGNYLETPKCFLYMSYLTLLGHIISDSITLKSEISPQPRLYTVLLGESADVRKSTSISKAYGFYKDTISAGDLNPVWGAGSGEGLAKSFETNNRVILLLDELKAIIQKMRIEASSLLPCINTLFESNIYHNQIKKTNIAIDDGQLCLLAASTLDTYQNMFNATFLDIGFINRLFIVIGDSERKFSIPEQIPAEIKAELKKDLRSVLSFVDAYAGVDPYAFPINTTARDIFDEWYFNLESSIFTKRLDTYGHRLLILLAANEQEHIITPEIAEKVISLLDYQLKARKFADPIDADSTIARVEETVRRKLMPGPLTKRELERKVNKSRVGVWVWNQAIENLTKDQQIIWDQKRKVYRLLGD